MLVVVVRAGTSVTTTVREIYRRSNSRLRYGNYDSTEIYRRSQAV